MRTARKAQLGASRAVMAGVILVVAVATALVTALLVNIFERKSEARNPYVRLAEVTEDNTDPAKWGINWPQQYDWYLRTAQTTRTRFGGHGGSEALPEEKIERDPWLKRMFLGYAFSIDYRDRRGHAYMLADQEATKRLTKPQSGSCLHCHASVMPLYRELGNGDAAKGFAESYKFSYQDLNKKLHDSGHAHPVTCVDCHDPKTMQLRVTRPGFIHGIQALAASDAPAPHLPSIERWRAGDKSEPYDPNVDASRSEMRSFVCGQCHVEYYCSSQMPLTFPWGKGLRAGDQEKFWDETKFPDGTRFFDYKHAETGAPILKAQHPEFELWSQGIHARSGVGVRRLPHALHARRRDQGLRPLGAQPAAQHQPRLPDLPPRSGGGDSRRASTRSRPRNYELMQRGGAAHRGADRRDRRGEEGGRDARRSSQPALELQRKAQWRLDFIAAENSMGFHAPQEAARVLGEAIDYARQGEVAAARWKSPAKEAAGAAAPDADATKGRKK